MSTIGVNGILSWPEGGDIFCRQDYYDNLTRIERALALRPAIQKSFGSGVYGVDPPLQAYEEAAQFIFIPASSNTGACSINVSNLGAKVLYDSDGNPITAAGAIQPFHLYLLQYSSALGSGGGFYSWELENYGPDLAAHKASGDHDSRYYTQAQIDKKYPAYKREFVYNSTPTTPTAFNAANPYDFGTAETTSGEILHHMAWHVGTLMFSMMVHVPTTTNVQIPVVYCDDDMFMFVDGTQVLTHSGPGGPFTADTVNLTAGDHLIQFIVRNTNDNSAHELAVAAWFGTAVQFLRAAKS